MTVMVHMLWAQGLVLHSLSQGMACYSPVGLSDRLSALLEPVPSSGAGFAQLVSKHLLTLLLLSPESLCYISWTRRPLLRLISGQTVPGRLLLAATVSNSKLTHCHLLSPPSRLELTHPSLVTSCWGIYFM